MNPMMVGDEVCGIDHQRIALPVPDRFAVEAGHGDIGVRVTASVHVDDPHAVHQLLDHENRSRQLNHGDRPRASHHDRQARRPAETDVAAVHLAFLRGFLCGVIMHLSRRRELEARGRIEPLGGAWSVVHPRARQVERGLWTRCGDVRRRQHAELRRCRSRRWRWRLGLRRQV